MVDASAFVLERRDPEDGAILNGECIPSLFVYLLNIFSKMAISQFANECGANPRAADPIGVIVAHIFSDDRFKWRGKSMIDILMAKYRHSCPALFGCKGSDKTAAGRSAIGWRREGGGWIPEQAHNDRMAGLGAGYAAISLRDFSKSKYSSPYTPAHYWKAFAAIVNTPPAQTSNTQFIVLKAMIDGHEARFLQFYGNAGLAALQVAVREFPQRAPHNSGAQGLQVLGEILRKEKGLQLD
jgi:nucleoporin GLE1